ncbi:MAG: hypothetical protein PWP34_993 [Desulfuromonadales bacterium]|nr:hypothetical protein [Desulfuromonadales bacterium]
MAYRLGGDRSIQLSYGARKGVTLYTTNNLSGKDFLKKMTSAAFAKTCRTIAYKACCIFE